MPQFRRSKSAYALAEVDSSGEITKWISGAKIKGSQVLPGLYVGNFRDSKDQEQLQANNITHIISIHDNARKVHEDKEYLCIQASDTPRQNLSQFFSQCNDFIHSARNSGGNVLIHCLAGVSRSVTIAVAYIMSITSLSWRDALKALRGARSIANPNFGFQKQLSDFESRKLNEERRRLRNRFPPSTFRQDEAECRQLLISYHNTVRPTELCAGICRRCPAMPSVSQPPSRPQTPQTPTRSFTPQTPTRSFAPQTPTRTFSPQTPTRTFSPQTPTRSFATPQPPGSPRRRPAYQTPPSSPRRYPRRRDNPQQS